MDLEFFQRWLELVDQDQDHNVISLYDLNSHQIARKPLIKAQLGQMVIEEKLNTVEATASPEPFAHRILSPVDSFDINLNRADAALYQAKHLGRNRIEIM